MARIGHNQAPHQLETVEIDALPVTLYKRSDTKDTTNWHMRIKVPGSTKYVRQSTKCDDLAEAKVIAMKRFFEIEIQQKNNIPVFSKTFSDICKEVQRDLEAKADRGEITPETLVGYKSKINRYFIPYFGKNRFPQSIKLQ